MPKWTEYTSKDTLADNDEVMLYDATGKANKRGLMSKFWDYVVDKMATAVISKLETNNKTIIGAINALNSETSINLLPIKENSSFSAALKGKNYVMIVGYFYTPSDCPFSFSVGYYIAFRSSYLVDPNVYTIVGINTNGNIECKTVQLQ